MIALGTKRILVVDDDVEMARIMEETLSQKDYQVFLAHDGIQAIAQSRKERPDLILLDVRMPFFSGFWFCDAFKQRPETKDIPIVMVSALTDEDHVQKAHDLGAAGYLKKPFLPQQLLELVEQIFAA